MNTYVPAKADLRDTVVRMSTDLSGIAPAADLRVRRISADIIAESLREAIQSGALADGAELNQVAIAAHFGVSRVPVREAMRALQAEGLIDSQAHRRAVVRGLSLDRLLETYDMRALIEGHLVEVATERISVKLLNELRELESQMRTIEDHGEWLRANADFHRRLYEPADNQTAFELIDLLRNRAERYVRLWSGGAGLHQPLEAGLEHAAVLRHVGEGNGPAARVELEKHILSTRDRLSAYARSLVTP
jgi:DNA-binding GntR family transcriptional regulator